MKHKLIAINILLLLSLSTQAQWNEVSGQITTTDKVGIGTTSPKNKQHIIATTSGDGLLIERDNSDNGSYSGLLFKNVQNDDDSYKKGAVFFEKTGSSGRGKLHFALNIQTTIAMSVSWMPS